MHLLTTLGVILTVVNIATAMPQLHHRGGKAVSSLPSSLRVTSVVRTTTAPSPYPTLQNLRVQIIYLLIM